MQICLEWQKYRLAKMRKTSFLFSSDPEQVIATYSAIKKTGLPSLLVFIASMALLLLVLILPNTKQNYLTQNFVKISILFFLAPAVTIFQNVKMKKFALSRISNLKIVIKIKSKYRYCIERRNKVVPIRSISAGVI